MFVLATDLTISKVHWSCLNESSLTMRFCFWMQRMRYLLKDIRRQGEIIRLQSQNESIQVSDVRERSWNFLRKKQIT